MLSISLQLRIRILFVVPPSSDTVIEYVNTLGYPSTLRNVSAMKNLAMAERGKKKTAHLLILSVRFTKLIIHHYSHEESILNTLRFVGKEERSKAKEEGATESSDAIKVTKPKAA
ncbi:hypothetical protein Tco_1464223 [Tanacetum coccineum]